MRVGIRRNIDNLGRITIPVSFRRSYNLEKGQEVAIVDTDEGVLIFNPNKKKEKEALNTVQRLIKKYNSNDIYIIGYYTSSYYDYK